MSRTQVFSTHVVHALAWMKSIKLKFELRALLKFNETMVAVKYLARM